MATADFASHQVEILYDSDPNPICAGNLISAYLVLTVYSCLVGKNDTKLKVRALGHAQIRNVNAIHSYPAQRSNSSENDIAVLLLDSDFHVGESVRSINIIEHDSSEPEGFIALSSLSSSVSCGHFPVVKAQQSDSDCSRDDPNLICVKTAESSSCPVPSIGSGLICRVHGLYFLCGALAENSGKSRTYTDISKYLHWIRLTFEAGKSAPEVPDGHALGATVFGGREVSAPGSSLSIPYQLSLQVDRGGNWKHICGAVIIDSKTALTAAHCFNGTFKPSDFRVVAGITHLDSNSSTKQILPLQQIIRHFRYQNRNVFMGNDIAIVQVDGSFVYNENVSNIWISPPNGTKPTDFSGRVSGYGQISNEKQVSNSLKEADMAILEDSECKKTWKFLKPSMVCGYDAVANSCDGDSGGPLAIRDFQFSQNRTRDLLIGIGSFGPLNCEAPEQPNGLTKVSHFYKWIKENRASKCAPTEFQCLNGHCIDECSVCDGADECGDGSDQRHCEEKMDPGKLRQCFQKNWEKFEKTKEELQNLIQSQTEKINELEEKVKTLNKTILEKNCSDDAGLSVVSFYEDTNFKGSETRVIVNSSCQNIPSEWNDRPSSLRSSACVAFYKGKRCSHRSQQLNGSHADLSLFDLDNHISSFQLCNATNERKSSITPNSKYPRTDFYNITAKMTIPNLKDPTETELMLCVNSYDQNGAKDSIATIELPSGYIFYPEDYEEGSEVFDRRPRNIQRFELKEGNTKMDVYYTEIPAHPPTCISLDASQQILVPTGRNPSIVVYEYLNPARRETITYLPAHKVKACQLCQLTGSCQKKEEDGCD